MTLCGWALVKIVMSVEEYEWFFLLADAATQGAGEGWRELNVTHELSVRIDVGWFSKDAVALTVQRRWTYANVHRQSFKMVG